MSKQHTDPGVFIIESLEIEDENSPKEGEMIAHSLEMSAVDNRYIYIRTKDELIFAVDQFIQSNFRFLHLSCHGKDNAIATTLHIISHSELSEVLENKLKYRRLFLSACSTVNTSLAGYLFKTSGCNSIIGPEKAVNMDEVAIFWASFYHLMFKGNPSAMKKKNIVETLDKLVKLYEIPFVYYRKSTKAPYFKEEKFLVETQKPSFDDYVG